MYPLATSTWGKEELDAIQKVIDTDMYTMGKHVKQFESEFAKYFGSRNAIMTNSGSSANLLMLSLLKWKYKLTGDIIVPAVGWSTTYFPVSQNNFKLNFVDVDPETYNIDVNKIEKAITPQTVAIMTVNLLGNACDYDAIQKICDKHKLILIEDNCESMGARYNDKYAGTFGLTGSHSFFFSHHIQTMEGGMVLTDNDEDADFMRSLRAHGWCRELPMDSKLYKRTGDAFFDNFTFITPGYAIRPLEMSGAIGSVQLKKWPAIMQTRLQNKIHFFTRFEHEPWIRLQKEIGESSWFTFGVVLTGELKGRRPEVIKALTSAGVQTRPLASRNFVRQPVMKELEQVHTGVLVYEGADDIHDNGFFVGNGSEDLSRGIDKMHDVMKKLVYGGI